MGDLSTFKAALSPATCNTVLSGLQGLSPVGSWANDLLHAPVQHGSVGVNSQPQLEGGQSLRLVEVPRQQQALQADAGRNFLCSL